MSLVTTMVIMTIFLAVLQHPADGRMCRRPRPLRNGRYEYERRGDYPLTRLPEGYVVRVICAASASLVGDEFLVCRDTGSWNAHSYCRDTSVYCAQDLGAPANGFVRMRGYTAGSVARYGCNPGFQLYGKEWTVCNKTTGVWRGELPLCIRNPSCPPLAELPGNVTVALRPQTGHFIEELSLYTNRSVLMYTCGPGYYPYRNNDVNITCQDGAWLSDGEAPECRRILCNPPSLEEIEHGNSSVENRKYEINEIVRYGCDVGYRLDGRSWQVCREGDGPIGVWLGRVPRCQVVQCPDPGPLHMDVGTLSFSSPDRGLGSIMTLRCPFHLILLGSSERVCQANGQWSGTTTSCDSEENYCPALGNPIHGSKIQPVRYGLNNEVTFRCDPGTDSDGNPLYEMVGSAVRRCDVSRTWSGEMPRCMARNEFDDMGRVTSIMGDTFDDLEIDGNLLEDSDHNSVSSRRKRAIDLNSKRGLDIFFAFDASGSIGKENFNYGKIFAQKLVEKIHVSQQPGGARVGALVYSTTAKVIFDVTEYNSTNDVLDVIETSVKLIGEGTNLPKALHTIKDQMIPLAIKGAPGNRRVLFIITDGLNNMGGEPLKVGREIREESAVAIHCIGISPNISKTALNELASEPRSEHVFFIDDYESLEKAVLDATQSNRSYDACGKARYVDESTVSGRAIGGEEVTPGRWPWQAAIYKTDPSDPNLDGDFQCGGTLIAKRWVLTAAHCFKNLTGEETVVYLGLTNRATDVHSERAQRFFVEKLVKHDDFTLVTYYNDIALLELDHEAQLNMFVRTICLPPDENEYRRKARRFLKANKLGHVIGWGHEFAVARGSKESLFPVDGLKEITLPIAADEPCKEKMRLPADFSNIQFCAGLPEAGSPDACKGDSGGPLMVHDTRGYRNEFIQVGIVSYGYGCGAINTYGIYTRLPAFVGWVKNQMNST